MANRMHRILVTYLAWWLTIIALIVGVALLWLAHGPLAAPEPGVGGTEFWHDLARDVGIAFIVATIVAGIFELHARTRFHVETIEGVMGSIMGDFVGDDVWNEVKGQIFDRTNIRRDVRVGLTISQKDAHLGLIVVGLSVEYAIHGLKAKPTPVVVEPYLDDYMKNKIPGYPKFESVSIGGKNYKGEHLNDRISEGMFKETFELEGRGGKTIRMVTERSELAYMPGSYNLVMGELTQKFTLCLEAVPNGVVAAVKIGPQKEWAILDQTQDLESECLLLPGQVIEFRFQKRP